MCQLHAITANVFARGHAKTSNISKAFYVKIVNLHIRKYNLCENLTTQLELTNFSHDDELHKQSHYP